MLGKRWGNRQREPRLPTGRSPQGRVVGPDHESTTASHGPGPPSLSDRTEQPGDSPPLQLHACIQSRGNSFAGARFVGLARPEPRHQLAARLRGKKDASDLGAAAPRAAAGFQGPRGALHFRSPFPPHQPPPHRLRLRLRMAGEFPTRATHTPLSKPSRPRTHAPRRRGATSTHLCSWLSTGKGGKGTTTTWRLGEGAGGPRLPEPQATAHWLGLDGSFELSALFTRIKGEICLLERPNPQLCSAIRNHTRPHDLSAKPNLYDKEMIRCLISLYTARQNDLFFLPERTGQTVGLTHPMVL